MWKNIKYYFIQFFFKKRWTNLLHLPPKEKQISPNCFNKKTKRNILVGSVNNIRATAIEKKIIENNFWERKAKKLKIFFNNIKRVIQPNTSRIAVTTEFYLDNGADVNMVNQSFAFEHESKIYYLNYTGWIMAPAIVLICLLVYKFNYN